MKTPHTSNFMEGMTPYGASADAVSTSYTDVVNVTGKGFLCSVIQRAYGDSSHTVEGDIKITIDGTQVIEIEKFSRCSTYSYDETQMYEGNLHPLLPFKTSLKVEHKANWSSYHVYTNALYVKK